MLSPASELQAKKSFLSSCLHYFLWMCLAAEPESSQPLGTSCGFATFPGEAQNPGIDGGIKESQPSSPL